MNHAYFGFNGFRADGYRTYQGTQKSACFLSTPTCSTCHGSTIGVYGEQCRTCEGADFLTYKGGQGVGQSLEKR